jgi:hypothetical protein
MAGDDEIQRNRSFFRTLNERLIERADSGHAPTEDWRFFCECGAHGCDERLDLPAEELRRLTKVAGCHVAAPDHVDEGEEVIVRGAGYALVADGGPGASERIRASTS